jgi:hypothetical protein
MLRRKNFLRWSLLASLTGVGAVILSNLGWFGLMYRSDFTRLTVVTLLAFAFGTLWCGYLAWRADELEERRKDPSLNRAGIIKDIENDAGHGWLIADFICPSLGLLGTVLGLFATFMGAFEGFRSTDPDAIQRLLGQISAGMSTALVTTIVGLVCSILLSVQLHILGWATERMKKP